MPLHQDFSSFGSGPDSEHRDATEAKCYGNFENLVEKIIQYERALDVHDRLNADGILIENGDNTFIFSASIDNGVILAEEGSEETKLLKVHWSCCVL